MPAIEVNNLTKYFGKQLVLENISLLLEKNTILNISGPSGAGKTTLLRCIAGLEKFSEGIIKLNNKIVQSDSVYISPYKRNIGMVFQDLALWPHLTACQNIDFVSGTIIKNKIARKKWNNEILASLRIEHIRDKFPGDLSGGEQQRVALARAIAKKPKILLFDEPFTHLDKDLTKQIITDLEKIIKEKKITVIIVSHHPRHFENCESITMVLENVRLEIGN